MEISNQKKLRTLIEFLVFDSQGEGKKAGLQNVELAAVEFLNENFEAVVITADIFDESDQQVKVE